MHCPECGSNHIVKKGFKPTDKQKYKCGECQKQFVFNPEKGIISDEKKEVIDKLLLEKISLAGICRSMNVSKSWLQSYVNKKYLATPQKIEVKEKPKGSLLIEADEVWRFCQNKSQKQWVWLAINRQTRKTVGVCIGDRSEESAKKLWRSLDLLRL